MRATLLVYAILCIFAPGLLADDADYQRQRFALVDRELAGEVRDARVLAAMRAVPRHEFVPSALRSQAYLNAPLPIGEDQTISQPLVVALMSEALGLQGAEKVLEIGTGSGYQAAVLSPLAREVYTIEIIDSLAKRATDTLRRLGYENVRVRSGDGYAGWPEHAPFDAIVITAAAPKVPEPLIAQLKPGGRIVMPLERGWMQDLVVYQKTGSGSSMKSLGAVRFVPMTGKVQEE